MNHMVSQHNILLLLMQVHLVALHKLLQILCREVGVLCCTHLLLELLYLLLEEFMGHPEHHCNQKWLVSEQV